jgi:hypothetical protein
MIKRENQAGTADGLARDVDPYGLCALLGGPAQDLRSLGFVPEIRLENGTADEAWKELREEQALVFEAVVGRAAPLRLGKLRPSSDQNER